MCYNGKKGIYFRRKYNFSFGNTVRSGKRTLSDRSGCICLCCYVIKGKSRRRLSDRKRRHRPHRSAGGVQYTGACPAIQTSPDCFPSRFQSVLVRQEKILRLREVEHLVIEGFRLLVSKAFIRIPEAARLQSVVQFGGANQQFFPVD